jgi:predicted AlkP superfamily phosphohydrolase/phosphomutase
MGGAMLRRRRPWKRVAVLGLDGTPYSLIKKLAENGVMPHFASLIKKHNFYQMDTTIPEISSVAWSTFMTGENPGEHGIFGFTDLVPHSYKLRFPNFSDLKSKPFWKDLEKEGKRAVVINLPSTYPAKELKGILISGFVALRLEKASYPESIIPYLKSIGYRIDIDTLKAREDKDFLMKDLADSLRIRKQAISHFWDKEKWDVFIAVVTGTDRLQHFLMDAYFDESHPFHQPFLDYYNMIDKEIVKGIVDKLSDSMELIILSDHGFTKIENEVYLNRWLVEEDYLKFETDSPETIEDIGEGSRVFVMDPGRIYINSKGKFPHGSVSPDEEYSSLLEELTEKLHSLEHNGKKVIKRVFRRDDIYSGSFTKTGPDLVAMSHYGFDLKGSVKSDSVFGKSFLAGMHTQDDAFVILPEEVKMEQKPHISQMKEIILGLVE